MDDVFMQMCFRDNKEAVETVLRVIMEKADLKVTDAAAPRAGEVPAV